MHHRVDAHRVNYWFGRGHYWRGSDTNLYVSILGSKNGKKRVNRYSNPELEHMGAHTGVEDSVHKDSRDNANNAKVLMWNREALSRVGDESQECPTQASQDEKHLQGKVTPSMLKHLSLQLRSSQVHWIQSTPRQRSTSW